MGADSRTLSSATIDSTRPTRYCKIARCHPDCPTEGNNAPTPSVRRILLKNNIPWPGQCQVAIFRDYLLGPSGLASPGGAEEAPADTKARRGERAMAAPLKRRASSGQSSGANVSEAELTQYRMPVGSGPSSKTCPRWAPHRLHRISVRASGAAVSSAVAMAVSSAGAQ